MLNPESRILNPLLTSINCGLQEAFAALAIKTPHCPVFKNRLNLARFMG